MDDFHDRPVTTQVRFEEPVTDAFEAVTPRYDYLTYAFMLEAIVTKPSGHFSSASADVYSYQVTTPEAW